MRDITGHYKTFENTSVDTLKELSWQPLWERFPDNKLYSSIRYKLESLQKILLRNIFKVSNKQVYKLR